MNFFRHSVVKFIFGVISVILSVGLLRSLYSQILRDDALAQRKEGLLKEQQRNVELKRRLKESTSSAFIEKLAREKLGLVKEGDTVILLDTSRIQQEGTTQDSMRESNWLLWWKLFF